MGVPGRQRELALDARQSGTAVLKPAVADHPQTYSNIIKDELENA